MSYKQKIKKLRRLSFNEIFYRVKEKLYLAKERREHDAFLQRIGQPSFDFFSKTHPEFLQQFQSKHIADLLKNPAFMRSIAEAPDEDKRQRFLKEFPQETQRAMQRANDFLENRFSFLGVQFQLPDPIPWQSDPLSLKPFPTGFYADIDIFTNKNPGDVKHVWEVNRLQFVIELAKAYYLSGDEKYRTKTETLLLDWYDKNPYQTGIAWASALEVGVRALALIWILYFYMGGKEQNPRVLRVILKILYLSGHYLNHHLSIYFSPYNHLIGETAALFAIGFLFPGFDQADQWAKKALAILDDQVQKQFHADGGSVEQAMFYHHFTLGFYLMTMSFLQHNAHSVPPKIKERVQKALQFSMYMMRPDGTWPHIGDIDDARSIYFSNPTHWDFRAYQCFGAVWYERSDMKFAAGRWHEEAFWMLDLQAERKFAALSSVTPQDKAVFLSESGYYVFRSGYDQNDHFSFMDAGPLAHGVFKDETPSAAHGHADLLSIEIAPYGEPLLIDPGFSNYRCEYDWHTYFRSTAAHNTVVINNQSQAKQTGILKWSFAPKFKVLKTVNEQGLALVCAEHYGYQRLPGAPIHRRCFAFVDQKFWLLLDVLTASGQETFDIQWNFHFNAGIKLESRKEQSIFTAQGPKAGLKMIFQPLDKLTWEALTYQGGKGPEQGWISPTYRARKAAPLLQINARSGFPVRVLTVLLPQSAKSEWQIDKAQEAIILSDKKQTYRIGWREKLQVQFAKSSFELTSD